MEIADEVAKCALEHYKKNITKGKPNEESEWTVYAAIVAQRGAKIWLVSAATGTKCTTKRKDGLVLHDSHAEVLARRGLLRVLWQEILEKSKNFKGEEAGKFDPEELLEASNIPHKFKLRSDICLHLYISDSPCGDASIYGTANGALLYTGAKVIVSSETAVDSESCGGNQQLLDGAPVAREEFQILGKLRSKSGRSNIPAHLRSTSMSCSDKIVKWSVLGLQGDLLSSFLPEAVLLSSIIIGQDPRVGNNSRCEKICPQMEALERALPNRIQSVWDYVLKNRGKEEICRSWKCWKKIPSVHISSQVFPSAKSLKAFNSIQSEMVGKGETFLGTPTTKKRKLDGSFQTKKISPCGVSLNWQRQDSKSVEIVVGVRGIRQGKKPKSPEDYAILSSRLSRKSLCHYASRLFPADNKIGYQQFKREICDTDRKSLKEIIFEGGPLAGWLREKSDFERL